MSKTETSVSNLKINRGTYAAIQANLSSIGEDELIITTDKTFPVPTSNDSGKVVSVDSSGNFTLTTPQSSGMTNPMTTSQDIIVGGSSGTPTRLAKGNNGELLRVNSSGNVAYGNNLPIITTAPNADNTDGLIICVLSSEPSTKYDGYLYIITGSNAVTTVVSEGGAND